MKDRPHHTDTRSDEPAHATAISQEFREYIVMKRAFQATGGMDSGDEVARRLVCCSTQPISTVARWILNRDVLAFRWACQTLIPLFQFEPIDMGLNPAVRSVLGELSDIYDRWGCALWFATPNPWLQEQRPVDIIRTQAQQVLDAARVERFVNRV